MKLTWVNHSGFLLEHEGVVLLSDPWLEGAVFDDGLDLLLPSRFAPSDFARATHLWLSHEHPDHFCTPSLEKVPLPPRLPVLYQDADFGRVRDWCAARGHPVQVLPAGEWVRLGPDFEVLCQPFGFMDSWLVIRAGGRQLLNLNDCSVDTVEAAQAIRDQLGPIDLLMQQFSFGGYSGDTPRQREHGSRHMLWRIQMATEVLKPRQFMPTGSYSWFCHQENHHLNQQTNRIEKVTRFVDKDCGTPAVVLLPGQSWQVGDPHDSRRAVTLFRRAFEEKLSTRQVRTSAKVPPEQLMGLAEGFLRRLRADNPDWEPLRRARFEPTTLFLADHGSAWELHPERGLLPADVHASNCDVALASSSLDQALRYPWGGSTVGINGRFYKPQGGSYERFRAWFGVASYNHHKRAPVPAEALRGAPMRWQG